MRLHASGLLLLFASRATFAHEALPDGGIESLADAGVPGLPQHDYSTVVLARRPISAASSFSVRDRDFQLRPVGSVQDILRVTPGLVLVQHSGGGKANQYFLRGFDADHGTDLALSIDGVPINMVSHAHGQGFADTNFVIPEVIERVELTKGPYFASQGDFATAGTVNLVSRESFEHTASLGVGFGGSPGRGQPSARVLITASPKLDSFRATFAAELGQSNGPFDSPDRWNRFKLYNRLSIDPTPRSTLSLIEMSYGGDWRGSGQLPARAVESGQVSRFGTLDPSEGGSSARHQLALIWVAHPDERSQVDALLYVATYRFNLYSNFTLFLNDPLAGDEIEQVDRRTLYGGRVSYRLIRNAGPIRFDTRLGADLRADDIHAELWHTAQRKPLTNLRSNDVHEQLGGAFINEEVSFWSWARLNVGGRFDLINYAVDDPTTELSGTGSAVQFSPKASLVVTPLQREAAQLELYVNWGHGFHSNDVRGAFATPAVSPLTRAIGEEVGARARLFGRWDLAAAGWLLDLADETVWVGDEGTTAVNGPTRRYGLELETRLEITSWLAADLDVTFTHSQFSTDGSNGGGLALAPKETWSGGLSARHVLGPGLARGGVRFFGIGDRPATDDGALVAPGFTQVDLHLGYRIWKLDLAVDIENLFNASFRSAQFATVSRLRNEPAIGSVAPAGLTCGSKGRLAASPNGTFQGCEDVDYTPAYPFTVRATATLFFD
ncbi:MAG: TonB-dependent receptor plug domain-containing protein [Archangiaceae bacterium]|nr:TonB-dependent receptor plug domain-containing protein [Archangiaceae bacterium]